MKTSYKQNIHNVVLLMSFCLIGVLTTICFASLTTEKKIYKYYSLDINLFSMDPNKPLDSYESHGGGYTSDRASVNLGCYDLLRHFRVNVAGENRKQRFIADVDIIPGKRDSDTEANSFEVDFTDLKARSFELAKNVDGRV